jgi:hypothetical protein
MSAAINIQCWPTPRMWIAAGAVQPYAITDEAGVPITDEAGNVLAADSGYAAPAAPTRATDEDGNILTDENAKDITLN